MSGVVSAFATLFALLTSSFALVACVDTSPVDYKPTNPLPVYKDAGSVDSGPVGVDAALVAACKDCVRVTGCAAQYDTCAADAKCKPFIDCQLNQYCLNFSAADLGNLPQCIYACAEGVDIMSQSDPVLGLYIPVALCAKDQTKCGKICAPLGH